jgi:predicted PurR-regulated permease PerM
VRRPALVAAVSLATLTLAALLWKFRGAAALFVLSLAVAAALRPFVDALERRLGRGLALGVVYVSGLTLFGIFIYVVTHGFWREVDEALDHLGGAYDRLRVRGAAASPVHGFILRRLPPAAALYRAVGASRPSALLDGLLGVTMNVIDLVGRSLIVLALSAYWNASHESFERLWLSLLPAPRRTRAREIWRSVERAVGAHLRSEVGQSLLAVLLISLMFHLAHLRTPMLAALAAGVFRLVPFFGIVVACLASFLAGSISSPAVGALAAAYTAVVLVLLDRLVAQRWFAARRYSPTLVVFLVVALVDAYGMLGLLVASPIGAAAQVLLERLIATHPRRTRTPLSLADIEQRLARVRQRLALMPTDEASQLGNVVARLGALATEARQIAPVPATRYSANDPVARTSADTAMFKS